MTITTENTAYQHFSGSGEDTVKFGRSPTTVWVTASAGCEVSFDGGTKFLPLADGTHKFEDIHVGSLIFKGTWNGLGIAL